MGPSEYEMEDNTYWCDICKKDTWHPEPDHCDECEQREMDEARKKEEEEMALSSEPKTRLCRDNGGCSGRVMHRDGATWVCDVCGRRIG